MQMIEIRHTITRTPEKELSNYQRMKREVEYQIRWLLEKIATLVDDDLYTSTIASAGTGGDIYIGPLTLVKTTEKFYFVRELRSDKTRKLPREKVDAIAFWPWEYDYVVRGRNLRPVLADEVERKRAIVERYDAQIVHWQQVVDAAAAE